MAFSAGMADIWTSVTIMARIPGSLNDVTRRRLWLFASVLVLAVGAAAWAWRGSSLHPRVLLIGIDGADPRIVDRLIAAGKLPTIDRLRREGAYAPLRSREPLLSPLIWTTIGTGRAPQDHGVLDFVEAAADGYAVPITSARRRVPALWNIVTQFGRSVGFIGWYASFPVEHVRGFEVSDRTAFHQTVSEGATASAAAFPPELASELQQSGPPIPDERVVRSRFLASPDAPLTIDGEQRVRALDRMFATSEYYRRLTRQLQRRYRPQLLGVYFEWIDACSHLFMEDAPPRRPQVADADYAAFAGTVDRCYEYQDEVLADVLGVADERTLVVLASDHGFKSADRRPDTPGRADVGQAALWHLPFGMLVLRGASVQRGAQPHATILDIAPTVLRALDIPLARELPGHPIPEAFRAGALALEPPREVKYAFVPVPSPGGTASSASEKIAEMKALGYLSGSADRRPAADGRFAASFLNEGVALYVDGEQRDALRAFARAADLDPRNVNARAFAARLRLERGEFDLARGLLDEAVALDPGSAYVRLLRANLAIGTGRWSDAETELAAAEALDRHLPMLFVQRARLLDARGDPSGALTALTTAESLTDAEPLRLDILILRADAATRLGRAADADSALARASELASADQIAAARADVALARDDARSAIAILRAALDRSPESASLWTVLGGTYGRAGDLSQAIDAYEHAIALQPTALACKTLAALVFEVRHDRTRAVHLWEQSLELDRNQTDVQGFLRRFGSVPTAAERP
jgi:predicted AlkP superfamily phosphohydrolase/phosphomutase/tetratricopeptide (TPR) repeat protein